MRTVHVTDAIAADVAGADLLVVGGPTHMRGMSSSLSRHKGVENEVRQAAEHGEPEPTLEPDAEGPGLREWIKALPPAQNRPAAAAFDTRAASRLAGGAAHGIARRLRHHGYQLVAASEGFIIEGTTGSLRAGELARATGWGPPWRPWCARPRSCPGGTDASEDGMGTTVLSREELEVVVGAALSAPSVLNTQPWRFRAQGDLIELFADPARGLHNLDPQARELLISCGAALMNLRLALVVGGREPVVRLLPEPGDRHLLARVRIAGPRRATVEEARLAEAIPLRRTTREPFRDQAVPDEVIRDLRDAAAAEGARLDVVAGWHAAHVTRLVHDADREQRADAGSAMDVAAWTVDRAETDSGISPVAFGPRADDPDALVRDFALGRPVAGRSTGHFDVTGVLAVLLTEQDRPADQVRAGQALERVLLTATAAGLATALLTQPTEVPELRRLLRDPALGQAGRRPWCGSGTGRRLRRARAARSPTSSRWTDVRSPRRSEAFAAGSRSPGRRHRPDLVLTQLPGRSHRTSSLSRQRDG